MLQEVPIKYERLTNRMQSVNVNDMGRRKDLSEAGARFILGTQNQLRFRNKKIILKMDIFPVLQFLQ